MLDIEASMTRFPNEGALTLARDEEDPVPRVDRQVEQSLADTTFSRAMGRIVLNEYRATLRSLRSSPEPATVSHALIYGDRQSVAELEVRSGLDPAEVMKTVTALEYMGVIEAVDDHGVTRYSLVQTSAPA